MKKALSIILIFIALTNIVGFMPLYYTALQEIKSEVKLKISNNSDLQPLEITSIEYNNPSVFRMAEENEFLFNGRMYDFKSIKKIGGSYIFYALEDNKESNLISLLKAVYEADAGNKQGKGPLANLLKNFSKDFVACSSPKLLLPASTILQLLFSANKNTCTGYCTLVQNPPDFAC